MSKRTESFLTYLLSAFIVFMSIFGLVYPLTNPTAYAEMLRYPHFIPMVQNHIEIKGSCEIPMRSLKIDSELNPCKEDILFV